MNSILIRQQQFGPCFVVQFLISFLVGYNLALEESAGCFTLTHNDCLPYFVSVLCLLMYWVDLQCAIVAYPSHTLNVLV